MKIQSSVSQNCFGGVTIVTTSILATALANLIRNSYDEKEAQQDPMFKHMIKLAIQLEQR